MIKIATIAGSDASGGAGLEADLKTFQEYGLYGMAAVTLIATMNPDNGWSHAVFPVDEQALRSQLETVFKGVGAAAAKSGMLGTDYAVELTREYISAYRVHNYVLDPVMVCKGANEALNPELNNAVAEKLLPLACITTPNLFEASQLAGLRQIETKEEMEKAARIIHSRGAKNVFIKGGAKLAESAEQGKASDLFFDGSVMRYIESPLIKTSWTHGAGCTTAAAAAAGLARGLSPYDAAVVAKKFITQSLSASFPLNTFVGPGNPAAWRSQGYYFS